MSVRAQEMAEQLLSEKRLSPPVEIQGMCLDSFSNMVRMFFAITRCWKITQSLQGAEESNAKRPLARLQNLYMTFHTQPNVVIVS